MKHVRDFLVAGTRRGSAYRKQTFLLCCFFIITLLFVSGDLCIYLKIAGAFLLLLSMFSKSDLDSFLYSCLKLVFSMKLVFRLVFCLKLGISHQLEVGLDFSRSRERPVTNSSKTTTFKTVSVKALFVFERALYRAFLGLIYTS